jgi:hypothetical protein
MAESAGKAIPKPVTPRLGYRSASGRQNYLSCAQDSSRMVNHEPMAMIRGTFDVIHAMARLNLNPKFMASFNKRSQDGPGLVGHRKELPGIFAFEFNP